MNAENYSTNENQNNNENQENQVPCAKCGKLFRTPRGALQHQRQCKAMAIRVELPPEPPPAAVTRTNTPNVTADQIEALRPPEKFYWEGSIFQKLINSSYEQVVYWRKNLFMLPSGRSGKSFIREVTRLLNAWVEDSPLGEVSMKAVHVMPALLLQKPSRNSKSKDHVRALERRMNLWQRGEIDALVNEAKTLQARLPKPTEKKTIQTISKQFKEKMEKGDVHGAIKLLTNNMSGGVLPLDEPTIQLLKEKHPIGRDTNESYLLQGPVQEVNPIIFDAIDEQMVMKAALATQGGSGPSGLDLSLIHI